MAIVLLSRPSASVEEDFRIREWVFQAEVYERRDEALRALEQMLASEQNGQAEVRDNIVRAISVVKRGLPTALDQPVIDPAHLNRPEAVIRNDGLSWLLVKGVWLSLGDWVGEYYLKQINTNSVFLVHAEGMTTEAVFADAPLIDTTASSAVLTGAGLRDVLTFISRKEGLNSFVPSEIEVQVSGVLQFQDWMGLLDQLCAMADVTWTRRRDNMIFSSRTFSNQLAAARIARVDRKDESLGLFLLNLANTFEMELVIDDRLFDTKVDIQLQDQPWDEILDCLSIMNGFTWFLAREPRERPRLIIQKE